MSEEANRASDPKKWTEWSVVSMNDGTLRCKRTNVEDEKDAEYRAVSRPVFSPEELSGMIQFGGLGLIGPTAIAEQSYQNRYRSLAFRLCSELNAEPK